MLGSAALLACGRRVLGATPAPVSLFGVASFSYTGRLGQDPSLRDPLAFLRFCRERGAGGAQMAIPALDGKAQTALRRHLEETGAWIEGSVRLPKDRAEVERFETEVRAAREAGAAVVRTVMLPGRRYETFATADEYRRFREASFASVALAAPVVGRLKVRLAVENHKDYRAEEQLELLRRIGSEWVGVTVDTGNNLALLEDPLETVEALAPLAFTVHLKDMGVEECADGFLIAEVPFGQGLLDLPRVVSALRKQRPGIRFNVEMATRDPLRVPCLTERYWATFEQLPARELARALALVRARKSASPLPRVSGVPVEERLRKEDAAVRECLAFASRRL